MNKHRSVNAEEIKEKVRRFLNNRYSGGDLRSIKTFYTQKRYGFVLQKVLEKIWLNKLSSTQQSSEDDQVDLEGVRNQIHRRINIQRSLDERRFSFRKKLTNSFLKIAAILFFPLLVLSSLFIHSHYIKPQKDPSFIEIIVPQGSKLNTRLPDGSEVWVNSGSTLRYPQNFNKRNRFAEIKGEAFFDIVSDPSHPFIVRSGDIDIKVLGTAFNVMAYPDEDILSTTLTEGLISIEKGLNGKASKRIGFLKQGQRMVYQKEIEELNMFIVDTEKYTSWKDGRLIFRNDPLKEVIRRLERWYSTEIILRDFSNEIYEHPLTLTIEDETLPQVLEYLSIASPIGWYVEPGKRSESGRIITSKYIVFKK